MPHSLLMMGRLREEEFEMVVLSTGLELPDDIKELCGKLGVELPGYQFWDTEDISPRQTSRRDVCFAGYAFEG